MCTCVYVCVAERGNQDSIHISDPLFHVLGPQPQLLITVLLLPREGVTESHFNPFLLENQTPVVVHALNSSTWETEAGEFLSPGPAWSTE